MPKARLLKEWYDGRERHAKGSVVNPTESQLTYDEERCKANPLRKALFHRLPEPPAPAPAKAAPAPVPAPAKAVAKVVPGSIA